ncbi:MAG: hypothetical protein K1000chlam3_01424 [Chlamydiae bacterium]|nr:hypothetical protein [Chlamydiota bacterium]
MSSLSINNANTFVAGLDYNNSVEYFFQKITNASPREKQQEVVKIISNMNRNDLIKPNKDGIEPIWWAFIMRKTDIMLAIIDKLRPQDLLVPLPEKLVDAHNNIPCTLHGTEITKPHGTILHAMMTALVSDKAVKVAQALIKKGGRQLVLKEDRFNNNALSYLQRVSGKNAHDKKVISMLVPFENDEYFDHSDSEYYD